jgi:hypothetical protein
LTEEATTALDYALHEFYTAERRRRFAVVGDDHAKADRRRYLSRRRKSIASGKATLLAMIRDLQAGDA